MNKFTLPKLSRLTYLAGAAVLTALAAGANAGLAAEGCQTAVTVEDVSGPGYQGPVRFYNSCDWNGIANGVIVEAKVSAVGGSHVIEATFQSYSSLRINYSLDLDSGSIAVYDYSFGRRPATRRVDEYAVSNNYRSDLEQMLTTLDELSASENLGPYLAQSRQILEATLNSLN